ncbi:hypothetical protein J6590_064565 [Homalodisca vitripennis]|nr:hypothetical protein J6590_064565 [Homalodisca vitripennis]
MNANPMVISSAILCKAAGGCSRCLFCRRRGSCTVTKPNLPILGGRAIISVTDVCSRCRASRRSVRGVLAPSIVSSATVLTCRHVVELCAVTVL